MALRHLLFFFAPSFITSSLNNYMTNRFSVFIFIILLAAGACKSDYEKMVERELNSGVRHDSLFLGLYFGMTRDSFYEHCFGLNRQGLVTNGPQNNTVLYAIKGYSQPIDMNFYPDFNRDKIWRMRVYFNYEAWAPWNKMLYAEKLVPETLDLLGKWYGPGFLSLKTPEGKPLWVKMDGNRQLLLVIQDEKMLRVEISDMTNQPEAKPLPQPGKDRPVWEKKTGKK